MSYRKESFKSPVLHGTHEITQNRHRDVPANMNASISRERGARADLMMGDGFPMSKKGRRVSRQPGGRGKYG